MSIGNNIICRYHDNDSFCDYKVVREEREDRISVVLYREDKELRRLTYKNVGWEISSPLLSWYNVFFCSGSSGGALDYDYMDTAVQNGEKTAATVYHDVGSEAANKLISALPPECGWLPYSDAMLYVFRIGKLKDFFDLNEVKQMYELLGVYCLDWEQIGRYFEMPLEYFGNEKECGFNIQSGGTREQNVVKGLLLGYPVESTALFIR